MSEGHDRGWRFGEGTPRFSPWGPTGSAYRDVDGRVTATLSVSQELGMHVVSAEVHGDGQFVTFVFEPDEGVDGGAPR